MFTSFHFNTVSYSIVLDEPAGETVLVSPRSGRSDLITCRPSGPSSRRVDSLEGDLARLRSTRSSLVDERFQMQSRMEAMASEVEQSDPDSLPSYEAMSREAERALKHLDGRIAEADARILELENDLARRHDDLQALQDRLDRELDGLQASRPRFARSGCHLARPPRSELYLRLLD
jgi:uncharacterized coiled-coil protein SlyX